MLGLAVGDALGAPLEFSSRERAGDAVGRGLEMAGGGPWEPGEWTDDTALALAQAESIAAHGLLDTADLARRYIAWADSGPKDIGNTTRAALQGASDDEDARNRAREFHERTGRSAGNGTVMRAAPIALAARSREEAFDAARADAVLSHHDPAAGMSSAALCAALLAINCGEPPLDAALGLVEGHAALEGALRSAEAEDEEALAALASNQLGACWTTLAIALYAHDRFDEYESGVTWAIGLGGDTDTNGAVAGALLGCRDGADGIPQRWRSALRDRERVERAAAGLSGGTE